MAFERARTLSRLSDDGFTVSTDVDGLKYNRSLNNVVDRQIRRVIALVPESGEDSWGDIEGLIPKEVTVDRRSVTGRGTSMAKGCEAQLRTIRSEDADLVVMFRGGGSPGDFVEFDGYDLARSMLECEVPVVTALGHHRNRSIADLVAARAFQTPTALGEAIDQEHRRLRPTRGASKRRMGAGERIRALTSERDELRRQCAALTTENSRARASAKAAHTRAQRAEADTARLDDWVDRYLLHLARGRVGRRLQAVAVVLAVAAVLLGAHLWASGWMLADFAVGTAAALGGAAVMVRRMTLWPARPMKKKDGPVPANRHQWRKRIFVARGLRELRVLVATDPTASARSRKGQAPSRFQSLLNTRRWRRTTRES